MKRARISSMALTVVLAACTRPPPEEQTPAAPTAEDLRHQCAQHVGQPRVEDAAPGVRVAIGHDLANTILVETPDGNVVVDVSTSPSRAREVRLAFGEAAARRVRAIVFTHSHIDHVGGANVWAEQGTDIWATEAFPAHLVKQYALFQQAETRRGAAQYGEHVPPELLSCSALGRRIDIDGTRRSGVRMPTRTFTGRAAFTVGGVDFVLHEAPGETHDQLFVWLPQKKVLLAGDNFYFAFPNLYTIRGTSPRPVDGWIASLDAMRALSPEVLVPSHTLPVRGAAAVRSALTDYRDAIQWVRDETVRGANRGESIEALAQRIRLPAALARAPYLRELYGQVDWSVRAIYTNHLGWFDGRPEALYPLPAPEAARRELALMGGREKVLAEARAALRESDFRWALHLLATLRDAGHADARERKATADALSGLGGTISNTNGRAWLHESAWRLTHEETAREPVRLDDGLLASIPLETFFEVMAVRLLPDKAAGVFESVVVEFPAEQRRFVLTVRNGICEVRAGPQLPGTPEPVAVLVTDGLTWRKLATGQESELAALASRRLKITGSVAALSRFMGRFDRTLQ